MATATTEYRMKSLRVWTHHDDVEEVVVGECVEDLFDGCLGDLDAQSFHAAADVQQNDNILRTGRRPDVPARIASRVKYTCSVYRQCMSRSQIAFSTPATYTPALSAIPYYNCITVVMSCLFFAF